MIKYNNQQTGGTLLGVIIGLIIGLAVAVIVALAINKGPMPFLNKSGKVEKPADLTPGQIADPNTPMYGNKDAVKEAAKDFVKDDDTPAAVPDAKLPADKLKAVDKPADAKPVDAKPDAVATAAEEKFIYYLQAGAFSNPAEAEATKAKLALQGFEAIISPRASDNGTLYRVRMGPYTQLDAMNRVRSKLTDSGMDISVVRNTNNANSAK